MTLWSKREGLRVIGFAVLLFFSGSLAALENMLVDAAWLFGNLPRDDLRVLDVRPTEQFQMGHIPGARNLDVEDTFDGPVRSNRVAGLSRIQALFQGVGLNTHDTVVIYGQGDFLDSARLFWVLETYGHQRVAVLEGGLDAWQDKGYELAQDILPPEAKGDFVPTVNPKRLATKFSTQLAMISRKKVIVDARGTLEYLGEHSQAARYGHIPSAINIPWSENVALGQTGFALKPKAELQKLYAAIPQTKPVITYCNRGKHAAVSYFILRYLGYEVASYDGSWLEWGNDFALPVAKGWN